MRIQRLITEHNRRELMGYVERAEIYSRFLLRGPKRTLPQNRLMWSLLSDFADQLTLHGQTHDEETWKCIGMHALGREVEWVKGFEGEIVALGYRSSELDIDEMSNLIELLYSEGAQRGVVFHGEA
jgi:NinB protein